MATRATGVVVFWFVLAALAATSAADEIWVAPTYQQDFGGVGVGSNSVWPVSAVGAVRLAWAVPDHLAEFQGARVALVPHAPAGPATLYLYVCAAEQADLVGTCTGPFPHAFTGVANRLTEVDVSDAIAPMVGRSGLNYIALVAYTTPTTVTDHIVGLRFVYGAAPPPGMATLAANTFSGTQTAPAFVGSGTGLTGVATLGANTFTGTQSAPSFVGSGAGLTAVAKLTANTFTGTQTINSGNLDLDAAHKITRDGMAFLHSTGGPGNTFLGHGTAAAIGPGANNTAVGQNALRDNVSGYYNTAVGERALLEANDYDGNTAIGAGALPALSFGGGNTGLGWGALLGLDAGSSNTALGAGAGGALLTGSNNIYIDNSGVASESSTIRIGDNQTRTFIRGIRGVTTGVANAVPVMIDSAGQLGTVSSSRRVKEDIQDMRDRSARIMRLRPVAFRYRQPYGDGGRPIQYGLLAEEVAEVFPELAVRDLDGRPETVKYQDLSVLLLNELQKLRRQVQELSAEVERLRRP